MYCLVYTALFNSFFYSIRCIIFSTAKGVQHDGRGNPPLCLVMFVLDFAVAFGEINTLLLLLWSNCRITESNEAPNRVISKSNHCIRMTNGKESKTV